jgi:t-SNARE complex subunit (syntaxin)
MWGMVALQHWEERQCSKEEIWLIIIIIIIIVVVLILELVIKLLSQHVNK